VVFSINGKLSRQRYYECSKPHISCKFLLVLPVGRIAPLSLILYPTDINTWKFARISVVKLRLELQQQQKNTVTRVRERTIPAEQPPLVGEVSANF
jgi:hypothetical protein